VEIRKALVASTVKLEVAPRKLFGKPVQTVKVNCENSSETAKLASVLRNLEGAKERLEDDVRLSMRHLINNNVVLCGLSVLEFFSVAELLKRAKKEEAKSLMDLMRN
jgi:DNA polymerase elongation subunit (family B)